MGWAGGRGKGSESETMAGSRRASSRDKKPLSLSLYIYIYEYISGELSLYTSDWLDLDSCSVYPSGAPLRCDGGAPAAAVVYAAKKGTSFNSPVVCKTVMGTLVPVHSSSYLAVSPLFFSLSPLHNWLELAIYSCTDTCVVVYSLAGCSYCCINSVPQ